MNMNEIAAKVRRGEPLSDEEVAWLNAEFERVVSALAVVMASFAESVREATTAMAAFTDAYRRAASNALEGQEPF